MSFTIFQNEKTSFYAIKTRRSKSRKIDIFTKWLNHGFGPTMALFPTFFLSNIGQENVFQKIQEQKNDFLRYKNKQFKKSKSWHFFKGVNPWFWSTNGRFSNFYFLGNIGKENSFYDILHRKNAFVAYENKKFKKSKNRLFSKGVNPQFWSKIRHFSNFFFRQNRPGKSLLRDS